MATRCVVARRYCRERSQQTKDGRPVRRVPKPLRQIGPVRMHSVLIAAASNGPRSQARGVCGVDRTWTFAIGVDVLLKGKRKNVQCNIVTGWQTPHIMERAGRNAQAYRGWLCSATT